MPVIYSPQKVLSYKENPYHQTALYPCKPP